MSEPKWITEARRHIGLREIKGPKHNAVIVGWLDKLRAWWKEDETPWCGVFVAHCINAAGLPLPKFWMRARDWLNWGEPVAAPCLGCVAVFERGGAGHVAFPIGVDAAGNPVCIGGNQGDAVTIATFAKSRVLGYRVPKGYRALAALPRMAGGKLSANEA